MLKILHSEIEKCNGKLYGIANRKDMIKSIRAVLASTNSNLDSKGFVNKALNAIRALRSVADVGVQERMRLSELGPRAWVQHLTFFLLRISDRVAKVSEVCFFFWRCQGQGMVASPRYGNTEYRIR